MNVSFNTAVGTVTKTISFEVYPNPASSVLFRSTSRSTANDVTVGILQGGHACLQQHCRQRAGDHSFSIPVEGFAKGLCMVNIRTPPAP